MAKDFRLSNETKNVVSQCKVVTYQWQNQLDNPQASDADLSAATSLDISSQITSVTFSKNSGSASGSFNISLTSSPGYGSNDWKDLIKRGSWILIYMSNEGDLILNPQVGPNLAKSKKQEARRIRCIGYVDRVAVKGSSSENRSVSIEYSVTGRDIGVVYDSAEIWLNMFKYDKIMLEFAEKSLNVTANKRVHEVIELIHDLFYYPMKVPGAKVNDQSSLTSIALQWLLPRKMVSDIGFDMSQIQGATYWGNLPGIKEIKPTNAGLAITNPTSFLNGNAWDQLKRLSISQFHEMFVETRDDGTPRMVFRPIPWGIDNSKYPKNAENITLYKDLKPVVTVPAVDLIDFDLGEDDHSRYNSFLATISTSLINDTDNIQYLSDSEFPKQNQGSIKRHGFRPMHTQVDSIIKNEELANGTGDKDALIEFNYVLYDYWNNAVYAESGTITKIGTNEVKIGKALKFTNDVPYLHSRRYYIEGYTDYFSVGETGVGIWVQDVSLTRGFDEADLRDKKGFSTRNTAFLAPGEYTKRNGGK